MCKFMRGRDQNGITVFTPLGEFSADTETEADDIEWDVLKKMTERLGRQPSKAELLSPSYKLFSEGNNK